jgi:hypothetical protein
MGLPIVNEVFVNGHQVNGSLRSVEGFNRSVNKDMISCKQPFGDLQEEDRSVDKLVHEAGQEPAFSGKMVGVRHRFGLVG